MIITFEELNPEELSDIEIRYLRGFSRITNYYDILRIQFKGTYREGDQGNDDAQYMFARGEFGLNALEPMGALLDFSELNYSEGSMMDSVFDIGLTQYPDGEFPVAVIVGENCKDGIAKLINGIDSEQPASTKEWIFDTLEEAWKYLEEKIEEHKDGMV